MDNLIDLHLVLQGHGQATVPLADVLESLREGTNAVLVREGELRELLTERGQFLATVREVQNKLDNKRIVERAKAYLSGDLGLREGEDYRLLRKNSMDTHVPEWEMAEKVLADANLEEAPGNKPNGSTRGCCGQEGTRRR